MRRLLAGATIAAVCVAGVASAESDGFAGRWVSARDKLTLDISRCADGWCGVAVDAGRCGRTVLRLGVDESAPAISRLRGNALRGKLQLSPDSLPYGVQAWLRSEPDGKAVLGIVGHSGEYNPIRRMFDFHAEMVRTDQPACTPDNKVS